MSWFFIIPWTGLAAAIAAALVQASTLPTPEPGIELSTAQKIAAAERQIEALQQTRERYGL